MTTNTNLDNFSEQSGLKPFPKKKRNLKRLIIAGSILLAVMLIILFSVAARRNSDTYVLWSDSTALSQKSIYTAVSATGKIKSANSQTVYSTQSYLVKTVNAQVGDIVMEGDILCILDAATLEDNIAKQEANLGKSQTSAELQLESSQLNYDYASTLISKGLNTQLMNAQNSVTTAETNLKDAKKRYDDAVFDIENNTNTSLLSSKNAVKNAENSLNEAIISYSNAKTNYEEGRNSSIINAESSLATAKANYDSALKQYQENETKYATALFELAKLENADTPDEAAIALKKAEADAYEAKISTLETTPNTANRSYDTAIQSYNAAIASVLQSIAQLQRSVDSAGSALDNARQNLEAAYVALDNTLESYITSVETAEKNYNQARNTLKSVQLAVQKELESYNISLETSALNTDLTPSEMDLATLRKQLEDASIKSPINGTVTVVNAEVGLPGNGQLFIVEDTASLKISTTVKEYDIGLVKPGLRVIIKTDATGNLEFEGIVTSVAPAAVKTATLGDVEFAVEIEVLSKEGGLKIGLNSRLSIVIESAENAFAVPYTAVFKNASGSSSVFAAVQISGDTYEIIEIPVTTGVESDWDIQIISAELAGGMRIINDASSVTAGQKIVFSDTVSSSVSSGGGFSFMMGN